MAARTASKDAKAQSKQRLMSQKSSEPEEDEDDQESEEAEEGSPSIPKESQFNCDDDHEEVHTHKTQIKRRKLSMRDDYEEDQKVILCHDEWRTLAMC